MTNDGLFTGNIQKDSPQLNGLFGRTFSPDDANLLRIAYQTAWEFGGTEHPQLIREPGVSFNPRSARVASLLIQEGGVTNLEVLSAAILGCASHIPLNKVPENIRQLFLAVQNGADQSLETELIFAARQLDTLRHLHMFSISKDAALRIAETIATTIFLHLNSDNRLMILHVAALDRCYRTLL